MKKRILNILLNQYFLAALFSLVIIFLLPAIFEKYKVELIQTGLLSRSDSKIYFQDLNNDSFTEKIICYSNNNGDASFEIQNETGGIFDQWNYNKIYNSNNPYLFFLDANSNGFKEIYFFSQQRDSVYLNIIEPFVDNGLHRENIFIDVVKPYNNEFKSASNSFKLGSKINEGIKDVYFDLQAGFSGSPRNIYKYNYTTNTINKSPHLTNTMVVESFADINKDGEEELILRGYANGNVLDSTYTKRSDYKFWLTVLDNNLNFIFEPVAINIPFSSVNTIPLKINDTIKLVTLIDSRGKENGEDKIKMYDIHGTLEKTVKINDGFYSIVSNKKNNVYLFDAINNEVWVFNNQLEKIDGFNLSHLWRMSQIDIDSDKKKEWINYDKDPRIIDIYREDFTHPVSFKIPAEGYHNDVYYGLVHTKQIKNGLYFQLGKEYFVYNYFQNKWYYFKYLIYIALYFVALGMVWLISYGQKIRTEKKLAIEREITQLQIKTIKNQIDPHFVFNAINTISGLMLEDNKLEADDFICKFSTLMRQTLQGSDKISHTLKEELAYVDNYIKLQQIRFYNSFKYVLNINENVNTETKVPKHVLYTYVENAIKHGLSNKENGLLTIIIKKQEDLILIIENNGGGFNSLNKTLENSTGNGILIMEKIYKLYYKLYKKKINYKVEEFSNTENSAIGVRVEIKIGKTTT